MAVMRGNRVGGNWLMKWDELKKKPLVHYRVMHRKRVTSELHDSYFRLMTIKHSISKIEWASNDYIIELSSMSLLNLVLVPVEFDAQWGSWVPAREFEFQWSGNVVGKATSCRSAFGPWWVGPRPPVEQPCRTRKTQRDGHKSEGSRYYCLCSISSSLSQEKTHTTFSNLCNKGRGKYFVKEVFLRLPSCVFLPASVFIVASFVTASFILAPFITSCVCRYHCVAVTYSAYICACM